jgi:hypothetical protein
VLMLSRIFLRQFPNLGYGDSRRSRTSMQTTKPQATDQFINTLTDSLRQGNFVRLVLSQPAQAESGPARILARWVELKAGPHLSLCLKYATRDLTENLPINQAPDWLRQQLAHFSSALLVPPSVIGNGNARRMVRFGCWLMFRLRTKFLVAGMTELNGVCWMTPPMIGYGVWV